MAIMHPKKFTQEGHRTGVKAERLMYEVIRDTLPNEFHCFHSFKIPRDFDKEKQIREADFIITHKNFGLLMLEVKADRVYFDKSNQALMHIRQHEDLRTYGDPKKLFLQDQLEKTKKALINYLGSRFPKPPFITDFAAFPHSPNNLAKLPDFWRGKSILKDDLDSIATFLTNKTEKKIKPYENFGDVIRFLQSRYLEERNSSLKQILKENMTKIDDLMEDEVEESWNRWFLNESMVFFGGAGSGKTQLLIEKAERLGEDGVKTLVTCYNELIAEELAQVLQDYDSITVKNLYHTALHFFDKYDVSYEPREDQKWFDEDVPEMLIDLMSDDSKDSEKFDAILVDEGQDFGLTYWTALQSLLKNEFQFLHVAIDPTQVARSNIEPVDIEDIFGGETYTPIILNYNWRNTQEIAKYANLVASGLNASIKIKGKERNIPALKAREDYPLGEKVREISVRDSLDLKNKISEIVSDLTNDCNISNSDISILLSSGLKKIKSGSAPLTFGDRIGNYKLVQKVNGNEHIQLETVRRFKGKENLVIILIEDEKLNEHLKYIGVTRASGLLYVLKMK